MRRWLSKVAADDTKLSGIFVNNFHKNMCDVHLNASTCVLPEQ